MKMFHFYTTTTAGKRHSLTRLLPFLLPLLLSAIPTHAAPNVAVSVLPVHSLVATLMRGVGDVELVLQGGQSPHGAQLKPSQVRLLGEADLIVWVGPGFERALEKTIAGRSGEARVVTLMLSDEIHLLRGHHADHDEHAEHDDHDEHAEHDERDEHIEHTDHTNHDTWTTDPHIWLSVANAQAIARIVARELIVLDAANRAHYESNLHDLLSRLQQLRQTLHARLHEIADARYVVFHDAYRYFETEFNLRLAASVTLSPERPPGAKRIRAIKRLITEHDVRCVFSEPQFQPGLVHTLVADTGAEAGTLDPLGADLQAGPDAWFQLLTGIADSLTGCLK